jgi:TP901 family phage tail tape measure protein
VRIGLLELLIDVKADAAKTTLSMMERTVKAVQAKMGAEAEKIANSVTNAGEKAAKVQKATMSQVKAANAAAASQIESLNQALGTGLRQTKAAAAAYETMAGSLKHASAESKAMVVQLAKQADKLESAKAKSEQFGQSLKLASGIAVAGLGAGLLKSIQSAGDFEQQLNVLGARAHASTAELAKLSTFAEKLGNDPLLPKVDSTDALLAMDTLVKKGFSLEQAMASARGALQLGIATNSGFAESATLMNNTLDTFGLKASESGRVADLMVNVFNKGGIDLNTFSGYLQQVGASAKLSGQSMEQVAAAAVVFAKAGLEGSDAGTSLKTAFSRLQAPATESAAKLIEQLGLKTADSAGNLLDLSAVVDQLAKRLKGLSEAEVKKILVQLGGSDAERALGLLIKNNDQLQEQVKNIAGVGEAARMTTAQSKGLNGAVEAFNSTVQTASKSIGDAFLPEATEMVRWAQKQADAFSSLDRETKNGIVQTIGGVVIAGSLIWGLSKLATLVKTFIDLRAAFVAAQAAKAAANVALAGSYTAVAGAANAAAVAEGRASGVGAIGRGLAGAATLTGAGAIVVGGTYAGIELAKPAIAQNKREMAASFNALGLGKDVAAAAVSKELTRLAGDLSRFSSDSSPTLQRAIESVKSRAGAINGFPDGKGGTLTIGQKEVDGYIQQALAAAGKREVARLRQSTLSGPIGSGGSGGVSGGSGGGNANIDWAALSGGDGKKGGRKKKEKEVKPWDPFQGGDLSLMVGTGALVPTKAIEEVYAFFKAIDDAVLRKKREMAASLDPRARIAEKIGIDFSDYKRAIESGPVKQQLDSLYRQLQGQEINALVGANKGKKTAWEGVFQTIAEAKAESIRKANEESTARVNDAVANAGPSKYASLWKQATIGLRMYDEEQRRTLEDVARRYEGERIAEGLQAQFDAYAEKTAKVAELRQTVEGEFMSMFDNLLNNGFNNFFGNVLQGFESMLADIAKQMIRSQVNSWVTGLLGGVGGGSPTLGGGWDFGALVAGFRAEGGPVSAGLPYVVGERGPEIMVPSRSGAVVPNHELGGRQVIVNVNISTSDLAGIQRSGHQIATEVGRRVGDAVRRS